MAVPPISLPDSHLGNFCALQPSVALLYNFLKHTDGTEVPDPFIWVQFSFNPVPFYFSGQFPITRVRVAYLFPDHS